MSSHGSHTVKLCPFLIHMYIYSGKQMQRGAEQTSATAVSIIQMNIADIILLCLDVEVWDKMEKM